MAGAGPKNVLVVDQGSDTLKWGLTTAAAPRVIPNCVARRGKSAGTWLVGAEISATTATHDLSFFRTCDRCCPTNWDVGRVVWLSALAPTGGSAAPPPQPFAFPAFVPPPQPSTQELETRYAAQLAQLEDMGFTDRARNLRALSQTQGNVQFAVERLLQ